MSSQNQIDANILWTAETTKYAVTQEVSASVIDTYEKGKVDINFFASLCMPSVCIYPLPAFYVAIWYLIASNREEVLVGKLLRFALGLPRSHAKTTFVKILIVWLIVYDKISFPLLVCSNSDLAEPLLADIHSILCSNNLKAIYGDWESGLVIDSASTKKAIYHGRSVAIVASGWAAGIRGLNLENARPDFILCDDVQTRKNDESPTERATLLKELVGTIFKAISPRGDRYIVYIGNMYSSECILNKLKNNSKWLSMVTGAILENGQPLWPELFSLEDLMESYVHDEELMLAHSWFAEIMNDPQSIATSLLPNALPACPLSAIPEPDGVFITIDPAGFKKSSDDNVITLHYKFENKGYIMKRVVGILDPSEVIKAALNMAMDHGASLIGIEDVGYQQTLQFWMSFFMKEWNIQGVAVVPLKPHGRSKESRIRLFVAELYKETYYILEPEARRRFNWQASMYKIGKTDNRDDILDADSYGLDIRNEYWHLITNLRHRVAIDSTCRVVGCNTPM